MADASPAIEKSSKVKAGVHYIEIGNTYLVKDKKIHTAMEMFKALLDQNFPGLCITGTFPKKLRSQYGLGTVKFIWISTTEGKEAAYNPKRLDFEITDAVTEFIKNNKRCAVLLDGIELLILSNGFEKVIEFVKLVNDLTAQHDGIFILPINPSAFEENKLATLEQSLEIIIVPEKERDARIQAEMNLRKKEEEIEKLRIEIESKEKDRKKAELELRLKEDERRKTQTELMIKEEERLKAEYLLKLEEEERKRIDADLAMKEEERMKLEMMSKMGDEEKKHLEEELKMRVLAWEKDEIDKLIKIEEEKLAVELHKKFDEGHFLKCDDCKTPLKFEAIKKFISPAAAKSLAQIPKEPEKKPTIYEPNREDLRKLERELEIRRKMGSTIPFGASLSTEVSRPQETSGFGPSPTTPTTSQPTPQHNCPVCHQKLTYFPQYGRWHCAKCNKWFAIKFDKDKK